MSSDIPSPTAPLKGAKCMYVWGGIIMVRGKGCYLDLARRIHIYIYIYTR